MEISMAVLEDKVITQKIGPKRQKIEEQIKDDKMA